MNADFIVAAMHFVSREMLYGEREEEEEEEVLMECLCKDDKVVDGKGYQRLAEVLTVNMKREAN